MRIYLDNCCFNRPFDDQKQARLRLQAEAKLYIQERIRDGSLELVWSYILDFENAMNPFEERRTTIGGWKEYATADIEETPAILEQANILMGAGLRAKDALHLSCAMAAGSEFFVTTDDAILKCSENLEGITVVDPTSFVRERNL